MMYGMAGDDDSAGKKIRLARQRMHLTQEALGKLVGKSVRAVNDWENDRRKPKNSQGALEDILGINLDEDGGTPDPPPIVADNSDLYEVVTIWNQPGFTRADRIHLIRNWLRLRHPERLPGNGEAEEGSA